MHGRDAESHDRAADGEREQADLAAADHVEREARDDDRDQQRGDRVRQVVGHRDGQAESQHADEVHRPDAGAHGDGTAGEPVGRLPAFGRGDVGRQREGYVRGRNCDNQRERDEPGRVRADHFDCLVEGFLFFCPTATQLRRPKPDSCAPEYSLP